jgi:hypothetical protein
MRASRPTELGETEIKRGAAVLLYLLTWQKGFDNDQAVHSLRDAKLDVAVVLTPSERPRVHEKVLKAFRDLAGRWAVWDSAAEVWRERRKSDPA